MSSSMIYQLQTAAIVFGYFLCIAIPVFVVIASAIHNSKPSDIERGDEGIGDFQDGEK